MSEAMELLNNLNKANSRLASLAEESHIVIGDDRYISVPDELKRLAVQHDHNIETVTFDCPRYWDEHDMSEMVVYINYLRSDKTPGVYKADNIRVSNDDESMMHFDWTITNNVTMTSGNIVFIVCVKKTDENGTEQNHWNSEICKDCYVSEGLELEENIPEEIRPDIISQWHNMIVASINELELIKDELISMRDNGEFNGEPGPQGPRGEEGTAQIPIARARTNDGVLYYANGDDLPEVKPGSNGEHIGKGKQIIFIPDSPNTTDTPFISLNDNDGAFIRLRAENNQHNNDQAPDATVSVPVGSLMTGVPYTLTFCGKYWLVDSYIERKQEVSREIPIVTAESEDGEIYSSLDGYIKGLTEVGKQIIFIVEDGPQTNLSENIKLYFDLGTEEHVLYDIKLRSKDNEYTNIPVGALKLNVPYTMTFTGECWLIDSYIKESKSVYVQPYTPGNAPDDSLWIDESEDYVVDTPVVESVNGKTGVVTLTAADVGAASEEYVNESITAALNNIGIAEEGAY